MPDSQPDNWFVYILRCKDNSLYTGVTNDLDKRLHAHNHLSTGARYTRGRRPVSLVYSENHKDRSAAQSREHAIKDMKREQKQALIRTYVKTEA